MIANDNNTTEVYKTTLRTDDAIYEMVNSKILNKTSFCKMDRFGHQESFLEMVEIDGIKYKPFSVTNPLVSKEIILFPSMPCPFENEEEILADIKNFIHEYLEVTEVFEQIATYYVLFTWLYDKFNEVPYLRAIGDFGSGKSRFIQTIGSLCYKPMFTSGATTTSPIFRLIDDVGGTLVIDEADFRFSDMTTDIVKILNGGYQKGSSVMRMGGKTMEDVKVFNLFCPKIVATREQFSDKALESRFLIEEMGSGRLRKDIPRTLDREFYYKAEQIRNKLLMWRLKNYFKPIEKREEVIDGIHPRLNQIVIPLLSIIQDEAIRENLKEFIIKYNKDLVADRGLSWESDIIFSILKLEYELKAKDLTVKQITDETNKEIEFGEDILKERKVGWYLRKKLQLKTEKKRRGYTLLLSKNRQKLDMWKERFGITDADIRGERVNDEDFAESVVYSDNTELSQRI
jgi:hypothetical protein